MRAAFLRTAAIAAAVALAAVALVSTPSGEGTPSEKERAARARLQEAEPGSLEAAQALFDLAELLQGDVETNLEEGLASARRALAIREARLRPDDDAVADALDSVSMWLWHARRFEEERPLVERALAIRERASPPDERRLARDLHLRADLFGVDGDYGRALALRERAAPLVERAHGPVSDGMAVHLLSVALLEAAIGDRRAALRDAAAALEIQETILPLQDPRLVRTLLRLGNLLVEDGQLERAEPPIERARMILELTGKGGRPEAAVALTTLGRLFAARGELARARDLFAQAAAIQKNTLGTDHPLLARTLAQLGEVQRRAGDLEGARASLGRALLVQRHSALRSFPEWAESLRQQALLDAADGRPTEALVGALEAERVAREHFRASALGLSEREALARGRARVRGLDLAWSLCSALAREGRLGDGDLAAVLDEAIRSRVLVLDSLVTRQRILALHADEETAARVETLRRASRRLAALVVSEASAEEREQARSDADGAERALAEKSREFRQERDRGEPGLAEVRRALPEGTALVSYFRHETEEGEAYVASVLSKGEENLRLVPLGPAPAIDAAVLAWSAAVSSDPRLRGTAESEATYRGVARRLAERIWDPLATLVEGHRRVFVVPDDALHRVNLATLVTGTDSFLVESGIAFHSLTAERDLVAAEAHGPRGRGVLAVGDPAYGVHPGSSGPRFDPLPGSGQEARDVVSWSAAGEPAVLLTGEGASKAAFKRLAPAARVLHFAAHAFFETSPAPELGPLRVAGLALAGANASVEEGALTAQEIALLDLRGVEWAVLSGCATGQGAVEPGEGVLGLRRAFQIAGARTLIVSLWPVEDDATRHWMRRLYGARRDGASTDAAVRAASRAILDEQRRTGGTTHPYFWGAFVSIGDWR